MEAIKRNSTSQSIIVQRRIKAGGFDDFEIPIPEDLPGKLNYWSQPSVKQLLKKMRSKCYTKIKMIKTN